MWIGGTGVEGEPGDIDVEIFKASTELATDTGCGALAMADSFNYKRRDD